MRKYLRFKDLKSDGIIGNRVTLQRWIDNYGFPPGFLLGPNTRVFPADAVDRWVEKRKKVQVDRNARTAGDPKINRIRLFPEEERFWPKKQRRRGRKKSDGRR